MAFLATSRWCPDKRLMKRAAKAKPLVVACCVAARRRARMESALSEVADVEWCDSFSASIQLARAGGASIVIFDSRDKTGRTAADAASELAKVAPPMPIVLYASHNEVVGGALGTSAITDLIIADETDGKPFIHSLVHRAVLRLAADRVSASLRTRVGGSLTAFVDAAVRNPNCSTVEALAEHLGVHRQTLATWCRSQKFLHPEEVLIWSRLLLVTAMLEGTDRSVNALATELDFPSVVALRNQLKRYTGMTAIEVRDKGLDAVLCLFDREVMRARERSAGR
jgi:AraC-like DNA-binding protein